MRYRLLAVLAALAMIAAACSDDDSADTAAEDTTADDTAEDTAGDDAGADASGDDAAADDSADDSAGDDAASDGDVTVRWRTRPDNDEEAGVYQSVSDTLSGQLDGVALQYEAGGTETEGYQQALLTQLSGGEAPDVFWIPGAEIANFASRGVLLNVRDLADATGHDDGNFYAGPMQHLTTDPDTGAASGDVLWGLPRDVSAFGLYLNMDLINEAGADDPRELAANGEWDWEAFREVAQAVDDLGPEIDGYGQSNWWGPQGYWLNAAGGGFYDNATSPTVCGLDSAESVAGLEFLKGLYDDGLAFPFGEDPEPPFRAGNMAMFQNGRWATPGIRTVDFNWDVVKLPDGPGGPSNWLFWGAYVVNADTENPEAAWQLVEALTQVDVQLEIAGLGANIPSRVGQDALDQFLTFSPPDNNQAFLDGLSEAPVTEAPLWNGDWPSYSADMGNAITAVVNGERSIDDYSTNICNELNQYFTG